MAIEYKERYTVPDEQREEIIEVLENNDPMKPWTLLSQIDSPHKAMKEMVLDGTIHINADGDLYLQNN